MLSCQLELRLNQFNQAGRYPDVNPAFLTMPGLLLSHFVVASLMTKEAVTSG